MDRAVADTQLSATIELNSQPEYDHHEGHIVAETSVRRDVADLCGAPLLQTEHAQRRAEAECRFAGAADQQNHNDAEVNQQSNHEPDSRPMPSSAANIAPHDWRSLCSRAQSLLLDVALMESVGHRRGNPMPHCPALAKSTRSRDTCTS